MNQSRGLLKYFKVSYETWQIKMHIPLAYNILYFQAVGSSSIEKVWELIMSCVWRLTYIFLLGIFINFVFTSERFLHWWESRKFPRINMSRIVGRNWSRRGFPRRARSFTISTSTLNCTSYGKSWCSPRHRRGRQESGWW